jgi:hypothetical protein
VSATSGTSTSPATPRQSTQPTASSPSVLTDAQRESIRKWKQRDAKTRATILALLDESLYGRFRWCTTAADLWNAIRTEFEDGTTQNVLLWWTDLTQRRLEEATPLQTHIDHLQDAYRKLQNANFAIPEQIFALVILSSLPEEWNQVATSLHTTLMAFSPEERVRNFNSAFVTRRLLEHEKLLSIRDLNASTTQAFVARQNRPNQRCTNCRRTNHTLDECAAHGGPKYKPKADDAAANVAKTIINYDSDEEPCL